MPRKKSDITGSTIQINVRVSALHKIAFQKLGGSKWLRKLLADHLKSEYEKKHDNES
jgi:hypothetical protein